MNILEMGKMERCGQDEVWDAIGCIIKGISL